MAATMLAGCGGSADTGTAAGAGTGSAAADAAEGGDAAPAGELTVPKINEINLGEDYQDVTATIKILTNRTDIVDTTYAEYAA